MNLVLAGCAVVFFSCLAVWRYNALPFMLAAGASLMTGLYWYDTYTTELGLGIGLLLIAYSVVCLGFAMQCIFWRKKSEE